MRRGQGIRRGFEGGLLLRGELVEITRPLCHGAGAIDAVTPNAW